MSRPPIARLPIAAALAMTMGGCAPADTDPGPGGVSVGEARALDRAAEMLEERRPAAELLAGETGRTVAEGDAAAR